MSLSDHVKQQITERGLTEQQVLQVFNNPDQIIQSPQFPFNPHKKIYQSRISPNFILRVFVGTDTNPYTIITAYRTNKIYKYWQ